MYDINNDQALENFTINGLMFCEYKKGWRSAAMTHRIGYNIDKAQKELIELDPATNGCLGVLGTIKTITPRNGNRPFDVLVVKHVYTKKAVFVYEDDKVSFTARQFKGKIAFEQKFHGFISGEVDIEFKYVSNIETMKNDLEGADFGIIKTKFDAFTNRKNIVTDIKIVVESLLNCFKIHTTVTNMLETKNLPDFNIDIAELQNCIENISPKIINIGRYSYNKIGIDLNAYGKNKLLGSFVLSADCEISVIFKTSNYTLEHITLNFNNKKFKFYEIIPCAETNSDGKICMYKDYMYETECGTFKHREDMGSIADLETNFDAEKYISDIIQNFV
jgi:hypothetical protein